MARTTVAHSSPRHRMVGCWFKSSLGHTSAFLSILLRINLKWCCINYNWWCQLNSMVERCFSTGKYISSEQKKLLHVLCETAMKFVVMVMRICSKPRKTSSAEENILKMLNTNSRACILIRNRKKMLLIKQSPQQTELDWGPK